MFKISTVGLIQLSHQARAKALETKDVTLQTALTNAADTVMSAASILLRYEEGEVPLDVAKAVNFIHEHL